MIVRDEGEQLSLVRQSDHANLSGQLALAWGEPPWEQPLPFPSVALGARLHDEAWRFWDEAPGLTEDNHRPQAFFEVSRVTTCAIYGRGVGAVCNLDLYAGLMLSLHYTGFFHGHWDWEPFSTPDRFPEPERTALQLFVRDELARQERLRTELSFAEEDEVRLAANYKWLQLWDRISLDVCRQDPVQPWAMDYPATPLGAGAGAPVAALKLAMIAPRRYTLNPYPLLRAPFRAALPVVRMVPGFRDREAFIDAWRRAPVESLEVSFEPA